MGEKTMGRPFHGICLIVGIDRTEINDGTEVLNQYNCILAVTLKLRRPKRFHFRRKL